MALTQAQLAQQAVARIEWGEPLPPAEAAALKAVWGTQYDANVRARTPTGAVLSGIRNIRAGKAPSAAEVAALKAKYGAQYDARTQQMRTLLRDTTVPNQGPAPISPQPPPAAAPAPAPKPITVAPQPVVKPPDARGPAVPGTPPPSVNVPAPAPVESAAVLAQRAAAKVSYGAPLSYEETTALKGVWGANFDQMVKARTPTGAALTAITKIRSGQTPTPQETAALQQLYGTNYTNLVGAARATAPIAAQTTTTPTQPTTPTTPGAPATTSPYTPSPQPGGALPEVPVQTSFHGLDSTDYPKWLTDLLADPVKLAKPESAAAISNYLATIGDKRNAAQWMLENEWRVGQDTFNMAMTLRQQKMAEWEAQELVKQKEKELALKEQQQKDEMALGTVANENNAIANANEHEVGMGHVTNNATENANTHETNTVANTNNATANENQNQYWQGQNENNATANANQNQHWQDTIAFQHQELQTQAELDRENQQNQLTQSRYSAFGRAKAPNTRSLRSWG